MAARLAAPRRGKVTAVVKTDGMPRLSEMWKDCAQLLVATRAGVACEFMDVDCAAYRLIQHPHDFDVVVASDLFGDIHLIEARAGGLARRIAAEVGKPLVQAEAEAASSVSILRAVARRSGERLTRRVIVHRDCYDAFVDHPQGATAALARGDPMDRATAVGPMISVEARAAGGVPRTRAQTVYGMPDRGGPIVL